MGLAPIRDDQPIIADQVVQAGAGVRLKFGRARPDGLRSAIETALTDPGLRSGAEAVAASVASAGGAVEAAALIEDVTADPDLGAPP